MKWVYPLNEHETAEASTFVLGSVSPGTQVFLISAEEETRIPVETSSQGYFSLKIPLAVGNNILTLEALRENFPPERLSRQVSRLAPLAPPAEPVSLHPDWIFPQEDLTLFPGDWLTVACLARLDTQVSIRIKGLFSKPMPLSRADSQTTDQRDWDPPYLETRTGVFAQLHQAQAPVPAQYVWLGRFQIPFQVKPISSTAIVFECTHVATTAALTTASTLQKVEAPGRLSISTTLRLAQLISSDEKIITRVGPQCTEAIQPVRSTPQCPGTWGHVRGRIGQQTELALQTDSQTGSFYPHSLWVPTHNIQFSDTLPWPMPVPVQLVRTQARSETTSQLFIPLPYAIPLTLEATPESLTLRLFGAINACDFVHLAPDDTVIQRVYCRQEASETVAIELVIPALCGYDYYYTHSSEPASRTDPAFGLLLSLKKYPSALKDWRIVLDAGHGGDEPGAKAPTGTPEKDLNIAVALATEHALQQQGFRKITLTREGDEAVSLAARAQHALEADVVLSLHHNALPDGRDPQAYRGVSTYFYHPFSQTLAQRLAKDLANSLGLPHFGVLYDSLHMTRIAEATAVLVEFGFLTHPEDCQLLLDTAFPAQAGRAIAMALRFFAKERAS